jgi:uncharacterized protein YkwD
MPFSLPFGRAVLALTMGVVLTALALAAGGLREASGASDRQSLGDVLSKEAIIGLTNDARATGGLAALDENPLLDAIAHARATDMIEKQYFAHVSPEGEQASIIARRIGYSYRVIAENIAVSGPFSTNHRVVETWMQSPGHRKNILSPRVKEVGVSVIRGRMNGADTWISVQVFGLQMFPGSVRPYMTASHEETGGPGLARAPRDEPGEEFMRARRELEAERASIERDMAISPSDSSKSDEVRQRIRAFNEKLEQYNRSIEEASVLKLAAN